MPLTLRSTLLAALIAGLLAGLAFFAVQSVTTRPLIVQGEAYERAQALRHEHGFAEGHEHGFAEGHEHGFAGEHEHGGAADEHGWAPAEGAERTLFTLAADGLIGIGFGFLLVGAIGLSGRTIGPHSGLLWGLAGFVVFAAAPAFGLPPEPPGMEAADVLARQVWWAGAALATAAGLWALLLQDRLAVALLGSVVMAAPHVIGAPQPPDGIVAEHPALAMRFVWASLGANLVLWVVLGIAAGWTLRRLARQARLEVARA